VNKVLVSVLFVLVAVAAAPHFDAAQDLKRPEEQLAAIYALKVQLEIEQKQLDEAMLQYGQLAEAREDARARVRRLYGDLDDMVQGKQDAKTEEITAREMEVARAEVELEVTTRQARDLRGRIREWHERIDLLQDRLGKLRKALPSDSESLTGTWEITYLPSGDKGTLSLRQSGTLLVGEYTLEGGWAGSLQGTIVNGKVLLHRIDSKLGQSQNLEGQLSPDGGTIRGTWQNFILSGGSPTSGNWVAQKKERGES
jgi:hypothetical protein